MLHSVSCCVDAIDAVDACCVRVDCLCNASTIALFDPCAFTCFDLSGAGLGGGVASRRRGPLILLTNSTYLKDKYPGWLEPMDTVGIYFSSIEILEYEHILL